MPRNTAGVYQLPTGNPVITGTTITSTWANTTAADIGTELTNSLDRNGRGSMLAPFKLFDGTLSNPGLAFTNEPTTGLQRSAAGRISVNVLAGEVARFTSTGLNATNIGADVAGSGSFTAGSFGSTLYVNGAFTAAATGTFAGQLTTGGNFSAAGPSGFNSSLYVGGPLAVNGGFTTTIATLNGYASNDTLVVRAGTQGISTTFRGRAGDSYAALRWVDENFAVELARISNVPASGTLVFSHSGVGSLQLAGGYGGFSVPVSINSNAGNSLTVAGSSSNSIGMNISNSAGGNWSIGSAGGSGPGSPSCFFVYDNANGGTRFAIGYDGRVSALSGFTVSGGDTQLVSNLRLASSNGANYSYSRVLDDGSIQWLPTGYNNVIMNLSQVGDLSVLRGVTATGFTVSSQRHLKDVVGPRAEASSMRLIMDCQPMSYMLKADEKPRVRTGLIVEDAPAAIVVDGKTIDTYALLAELVGATQFLAHRLGVH